MPKMNMILVGLLTAFAVLTGCRGTGGEDPTADDTSGDGNGGDADGDADADSDFKSCSTTPVNLSSVATRVMLLEDKSLSMNDNNKWPQAVSAITGMVQDFENQIEFGLDLFSIGGGGRDNPSCGVGDDVAEDSALSNANNIIRILDSSSPDGATPLLLAMQNFLQDDYAPAFSGPGANGYLVVVSDGMDTCGKEGVFDQNNGASAAELADVATSLNAKGIGTIVIGFGDGADEGQLNAIAAAGGTVFDTYIDAQDGEALTDALNEIAETVVLSCIFKLDEYNPEEVNLDRVNVLFDGEAIPRDDGCAKGQGWTWVDADRTTIEFCDAACGRIESESVSTIEVQIACSDDDVSII